MNTTADFTVGSQLSGGAWASGMKGYSGEVWAYGEAFTAAQVLNHYNVTKWRYQ